MIEACDLALAAGKSTVLRDVGLRAEPGTITALLGPNGAGKTTLLRCLAGLVKPDRGAVMVEDRPLAQLGPRERARRIGYLPQRLEVSRLSVFDAVLAGRLPHSQGEPSEKDLAAVAGALRALDLEHLAMRALDSLSGGEAQRVGIARALVQTPRILLLDEPTAALDLRGTGELLALLRRLVREHALAAICVLHDLNVALRFADSFVFLRHGRVVAHGGRETVTEELIRFVYDVPVVVGSIDNVPVVLPALC